MIDRYSHHFGVLPTTTMNVPFSDFMPFFLYWIKHDTFAMKKERTKLTFNDQSKGK